ncbi:aminotransferase class V-fold PLP-dependent enzyme [Corynebacterium diphtheriae]|nr:aminotransferase class V-fold PLP-dependent enzyme [Corynebacterium diphtheriae]CAB0732143.1 aminotransferase class V-fold PLP-dependent enzyme [Corynebacterium diphtheriae]CAB0946038.1 aminotransferase class V-fold PLP-dependent enzyme [Corynebacterium diphtheriae]CAB0994401.1 aminotransferase class V-fold PLP-dependent enzyme [Corynebacterium diphtheriae]CAB1029270.1 aminotransferase class V-fold PLP-dependent enzyme [Corynebacterium diphtheriae]
MAFDVARVRGAYTSITGGWTYMNAQQQAQIPERVAAAVARGFRNSPIVEDVEPAFGSHARERHAGLFASDGYERSARVAIADLTGTSADAVILGPNLDVLFSQFAAAVWPLVRRGSSVVMAHGCSPAMTVGAKTRWAQPDLGTGEIPAWQFGSLVDGSTRLVALRAADPQVGTINPIREISEYVHGASRAWLLVDASSLAGHRPITMEALGADIVALDCSAFGGPQVAALAFRDATMFPRLDADLLNSSVAPGLAAGVSAAVDHIADLDESVRGTRRNRLVDSIESAGLYLGRLGTYLADSLDSLPKTHVFGVTGEAAAGSDADRIPHVTFCIDGVPADLIYHRLLSNRIVGALSTSSPLLDAMGAEDTHGTISLALAPFNTTHDVDQLMRVVASFA